jgi:predicted NAD/FAD-binding protein
MWFSRDFGDKMVYPLVALFLGTGNQTANVPCAMVERLFNDPNMKLWDYDPVTLLPNQPKLFTFGKLDSFYGKWTADLASKGVTFWFNIEKVRVLSRTDQEVILHVKHPTGAAFDTEIFDDIVLCTPADDSLEILGDTASWRERVVLRGVNYCWYSLLCPLFFMARSLALLHTLMAT